MRLTPIPVAALLGFNGGFVDTAGFLGLQGLFTSHVTGNFVTMSAALVLGLSGVVTKMLAIPVFILAVAVARYSSNLIEDRGLPSMPILLGAEAALLAAFCLFANIFGPFPDGDAATAMVTGLVGVTAMATQNAAQRIHLGSMPPSTILTGTTTQFAIDFIDLLTGRIHAGEESWRRLAGLARAIIAFGAGAMIAAASFHIVGLKCLAIPVLIVVSLAILASGRASRE